jgi:ornithine cyclodeaminase/alanine dehydrogenase
VIALFSAVDGRLLALLDSSELTARRTGAATAVAAKYLSRSDASVLTMIGCGAQAYAQVRAVCEVRTIERVFTYDLKQDAADVMAHRIEHDIDIEAEAVAVPRAGTRLSDIVITCTTARTPVLFLDDVRPGTFVAAVGADHPEKHEIDPQLLRSAHVVADLLPQCQTIGDLHHAEVNGARELAAFVAGFAEKPASQDEIIVFDSTGIALQDVFASAHVYEKALQPVHS